MSRRKGPSINLKWQKQNKNSGKGALGHSKVTGCQRAVFTTNLRAASLYVDTLYTTTVSSRGGDTLTSELKSKVIKIFQGQ